MKKDDRKFTTTDAGIPVSSDEYSLTVGPDGPILLQDHYLIEQMANFNRERIPERQPHAKGAGAFGHFEVTKDVRSYTKAAVFQPGTKTDTLIRFSTVAGERRSPDTWRDPPCLSRRPRPTGSTPSTSCSARERRPRGSLSPKPKKRIWWAVQRPTHDAC